MCHFPAPHLLTLIKLDILNCHSAIIRTGSLTQRRRGKDTLVHWENSIVWTVNYVGYEYTRPCLLPFYVWGI